VDLRRPAGRHWKVAHRGASALAPENSLAALEAALAASVDMIEIDVLVAGDGEARLAHSLSVVTAESPRLDDALARFSEAARPEVWLDLDVKSQGLEQILVDALRAHDLAARTLVTSFRQRILGEVGRLEPALPRGVAYPADRLGLSARRPFRSLVDPGLAALRVALPRRVSRMLAEAGAQAAMLQHALVSPAVVERCHAAGAAVFAWTVETAEDLDRVLAAGADGVIANDPNLFDE
jgi:glycerophosphoryl diester phosphodiesterase